MTDAAYVDEDTPEQRERCRALEFAILLMAFLDATWEGDRDQTRTQRWRTRTARLRRAEARHWFLDRDPGHRAHVEDIAEGAGISDGRIWKLVEKFVIRGEGLELLEQFRDAWADRPGTKRLAQHGGPEFSLNVGVTGCVNGHKGSHLRALFRE